MNDVVKFSQFVQAPALNGAERVPFQSGSSNAVFTLTQLAQYVRLALGLGDAATAKKTDFDAAGVASGFNNLSVQRDDALSERMDHLQQDIDNAKNGANSYRTLALANAAVAAGDIPVNTSLRVTVDSDTTKNGLYDYDGLTLEKSSSDELTQAKAYADSTKTAAISAAAIDAASKAVTAEMSANNYTNQKVNNMASAIELKKADDSSIIPLLADANGKALAYYDKTKDCFVGGGLLESIFGMIPTIKTSSDTNYIALLTDSAGKILIGWDMANDKPIGFETSTSSQQVKSYQYFAQKPVIAERNHLLGYGQSLKTGATATVILSTAQPYSNLTFNTGTRKDSAATSIIPLVEQFNNPSSDGYANRGETCCSGAANYASLAMLKENGIDPASHVIFASTAAHGGYTIAQLKKGSAWYSFLLEHVTEAKRLNAGKTYKVQVIDWGQGENNAVTGGTQTPYATYKADLIQLQIDASTDIKSITSQTDPVRFITYQMSYSAATWPDIAKAQLDLVRENDSFLMSTPMYHFPYAPDKVHLTNVGYKWYGAYVGRAYKQAVIEGRKSDFINPLYAVVSGSTIKIKFDVPTLPLQIDTTTLAVTTNAGFKVMDGATAITISSVTVSNDAVILNLASAPSNSVQVRYALDYLGAGLAITGGASGNLRDSTPDTVVIAGVTKPLYHVCPHFELTAFLDKGI